MGGRFGSGWSEVCYLVTSHFQYKIQYKYSFEYKIRPSQEWGVRKGGVHIVARAQLQLPLSGVIIAQLLPKSSLKRH